MAGKGETFQMTVYPPRYDNLSTPLFVNKPEIVGVKLLKWAGVNDQF